MDVVGAVVVVALGLGMSALSGWLQERYGVKKKKGTDFESRVGLLTKALHEATAVVDEIDSEIAKRKSIADKLAKDVETYRQIADLKKPQVDAVIQAFQGEVKKESGASIRKSIAFNFLFFLLGVGATVLVALFI